MSQMRITLNFDEDQLLKEAIREKLLEQIDGLSRAEISSRMDANIDAKLKEKGFNGRVENGLAKFFEAKTQAFFSNYTYGSNPLKEKTEETILAGIDKVLQESRIQNKIEQKITNIINEKMDGILQKALTNAFSNKKITLDLK
jgi:hypothetical protein